MDSRRREAVLASLLERCSECRWSLLAAHVRTNHVHIVREADAHPARVMNDLKSYASRCLNRIGLDEPNGCLRGDRALKGTAPCGRCARISLADLVNGRSSPCSCSFNM